MDVPVIIREIRSQLDSIMASDAAWCRKRLHAIQRRRTEHKPVDQLLGQGVLRVDESRRKVLHREAALPGHSYDDVLPITAHREEILKALKENPVIVVAGETGSGKTT